MKIHTVDWRADAWLGGTSMLGPNEGWLYVTIINLIYSRGGPIEADKAWLGRVANMHGNAVNASLRHLIELGKVRETDGKLMANGCEKQLETAEKRARNWVGNGGEIGRPSNKNNKLQKAPPSRAYADTPAEPLSTNHYSEEPYGPSGAGAPDDPVRDMWNRGKAVLGKSAGGLIGKARRDHGDEAVIAAIVACEHEAPIKPVEFFIGCLRRNSNKQTAMEKFYAGAMEAADELTRRQQSGNGSAYYTPPGPLLDSH